MVNAADNKDLAHALVHVAKGTRDATFTRLCIILKKMNDEDEDITEIDMMKIQHQLFYAFFMSDKVVVQQELAQNIADLVLIFQKKLDNLVMFTTTFFSHMSQQWPGLDKHRIDKFYSLIRKFLNTTLFCFVSAIKEEKFSNEAYQKVISSATGLKVDNSVKYHVTDIFTTEMCKLVDINHTQVVLTLIWPFFAALDAENNMTFVEKCILANLCVPVISDTESSNMKWIIRKSLINIAKNTEENEKREIIYAYIETMNYDLDDVDEQQLEQYVFEKDTAPPQIAAEAASLSISTSKRVKFNEVDQTTGLISEKAVLKRIKKKHEKDKAKPMVLRSRLKRKLPVEKVAPVEKGKKRQTRNGKIPQKIFTEHNLTMAKRNMKKNERMLKQFKLQPKEIVC